MKLVINTCYGVFSLSPKAVKRLAELNGKDCFFFSSGIVDPRREITMEKAEASHGSWSAYSETNVDSRNWLKRASEWFSLSDKERNELSELEQRLSLTSHPEDRSDPLLIQTVEELGEEANGAYAKLRVIEIPDGVSYEIDDYDGIESIHETHRSWA